MRKHVWLSQTDCDRIEAIFGDTLGFSEAIRVMLKKFLDGVEAKVSQKSAPVPIKPEDISL